MRLLIENARILTMAGEEKTFVGSVAIDGERIAHVGDVPESFAPEKVIDGQGTLLMPGLVNAHTHVSMTLFRGYGDDLPFWEWLHDRILPAEEGLTEDDAYIGAKLGIVEMIRSGVTTFADMYMFMDRVAQAVDESGIRANLSRGLAGQGTNGLEKIEIAKKLHKDWNDQSQGRIKIDIAPHAPYTCDNEYIGHIIAAAHELETNIHIHLSESRTEVKLSNEEHGMSPIENMNAQGLFDRRTYAAHCVHVSEEDIKIMADKGVTVVHNPASNYKLGNGFAPVKTMIEAGVNVALGTDGTACNNNLNLFEEIHLAALGNKAVEEDPVVLPAYQALELATINGAKALGLEKEIGTIEAGKKADIILVDFMKPHLCPSPNPISALVYSAQASDVKTVICNGEILMEDYQLMTIDEKAVMREAEIASSRLLGQ